MVRWLGIGDGRCNPAHATLAADTGCCDRTVRRATAAMRALGLLRWQTRLVRAGWRAEQTSNTYELLPIIGRATRPICCGGQNGRATGKGLIPPVRLLPSPAEQRAAQEALACVRMAREALLRPA